MEMKQHGDGWTYYWCKNHYEGKCQMRLRLFISQTTTNSLLDRFKEPIAPPWELQ
jgi:hypothetical protein